MLVSVFKRTMFISLFLSILFSLSVVTSIFKPMAANGFSSNYQVIKEDSTGTSGETPIRVINTNSVANLQNTKLGNGFAFKDLYGHWAENNIKKLLNAGVTSGYPDGNFKPDSNITRAEFATLLVKSFKLTPRNGRFFNDIAEHWAKDYVITAAQYGIVNGYNEVEFGPDDLITREQMAVMIVKAAGFSEISAGIEFSDEKMISAWAREAIAIASGRKIITGYPGGYFSPQGNATRAEAITVIVNSQKNGSDIDQPTISTTGSTTLKAAGAALTITSDEAGIWVSSNTNVATVTPSKNGMSATITAVAKGTTKISVTCAGGIKSNEITVTVDIGQEVTENIPKVVTVKDLGGIIDYADPMRAVLIPLSNLQSDFKLATQNSRVTLTIEGQDSIILEWNDVLNGFWNIQIDAAIYTENEILSAIVTVE